MVASRKNPVDSGGGGTKYRWRRNGVSADIIDDPFGRRRRDLFEGSTGSYGASADVSEHLRGNEDEGPTFGGGDEDPLYDSGDADGLLGAAGGPGTGGGASHGRQISAGGGPMHFFDDERRWGKRRADECCLSFFDGNDCASWLGDGEDLP